MLTGETLLLIASEEWELSGLTRHARQGRELPLPVDFAHLIQFSDGREWVLLANGPGPKLAGAALTAGLRYAKHAAVASVGCCGALDPELRLGDIVMASKVIDTDSGEVFEAECPNPAAGIRMASGDRVVGTAARKRDLRARTRADAVDMESAALARGAHQANLPFYCIRVVTDTALEDLHNDFNAARRHDGRFSRAAILRGALLRPFTRIPELVRLATLSRRASMALGDRLAACHF